MSSITSGVMESDSSSSEEEWVISSTTQTVKKKPSISEASIRTIRANIPKSNRLPPTLPKQILKITNIQQNNSKYLEDVELEVICKEMNATLLVTRLISVYKNTEVFIKIREIETNQMSFESRLKEHLHLTKDPSDFILNCLSCLSRYFSDHPKVKDLTPKFRRLLATTFCTALARFLDTPIELRKPEKEQDLITFEEEEEKEEEVDLISFTDNEEQEGEYDSDDSEDSEVVITLSDIHIDKYTLSRDNKLKLISFIELISSPVIVYYAMEVYSLSELISFGKEFEQDGVKLCKALFKHGHYDEYLVTIKKLNLFSLFSISTIAEQLFTAGWGNCLPSFISDKLQLQKELLSFINKQLGYGYAGNLGIVPKEKLVELLQDQQTHQLSRLKERKFQKDLVNCGMKILRDSNLPEKDYYFIILSQRYATLRFILTQRSIQQQSEDDGDLSIEKSSNFNGLIDLLCENDQVLSRLVVKELIDIGDTIAPPYFASIYKQQEFYCRYNALPLTQRLLGIVKGEQMSRHRTMFTPTKKKINDGSLEDYTLPKKVKYRMVNSYDSLMEMKDVLSISNICGIDTEWVPSFAKFGILKTALMQISTDVNNLVFLLDLKTIFEPENTRLYNITAKILQLFFEDENILKLAYDFGGDFDLLHASIPTSKLWNVTRLLDLKTIKTMPKNANDPGETIAGGLSGVVAIFLGVKMNKRQQLSNWEKRPLTKEQAIYAASDAYCLLEIYYTLVRLKHPFINRSLLDK